MAGTGMIDDVGEACPASLTNMAVLRQTGTQTAGVPAELARAVALVSPNIC